MRSRLREARARALVAIGEPAAARALLGVLASDQDPRAARPAMATLAAIELALERYDVAAALLRQALAEPMVAWPGSSSAEANLALVLLSRTGGEGLRRLHSAQAHFELERDYQSLMQALETELLAHQRTGMSDDVEAVRARVRGRQVALGGAERRKTERRTVLLAPRVPLDRELRAFALLFGPRDPRRFDLRRLRVDVVGNETTGKTLFLDDVRVDDEPRSGRGATAARRGCRAGGPRRSRAARARRSRARARPRRSPRARRA